VSKPGRSRAESEAELGARILAGWATICQAVPDGPRHNRRVAAHFRIALVDVEHLRDIRNRVAHPRGKIRRQDLERAASTVRRADRHTGGPPSRRRPTRRPTGPARSARRQPEPKRTRLGLVVTLLLVLAAAAVLSWLLFVA
jgi:hypothetical protein